VFGERVRSGELVDCRAAVAASAALSCRHKTEAFM
jgi:hypothetical protein